MFHFLKTRSITRRNLSIKKPSAQQTADVMSSDWINQFEGCDGTLIESSRGTRQLDLPGTRIWRHHRDTDMCSVGFLPRSNAVCRRAKRHKDLQERRRNLLSSATLTYKYLFAQVSISLSSTITKKIGHYWTQTLNSW